MPKLIKCGICSHVYLPEAHYFHCPCCASFPITIGKKEFHVDVVTNRQIAKPFTMTRSLAETLNKLAQS